MGGKSSRAKGHGFEREVAKKFRDIFPNACRNLEYQSNNCEGVDLQGTGPLRIQVKRNKTYAPISKIKEIKGEHGIHCLVTKGDREREVICLYLDDFIKILKEGLNEGD